MTEDQLIIAKAIDVIVSASPGVLRRARRARDRDELISRPGVGAYAFADLADAIEKSYPGAIDASRG